MKINKLLTIFTSDGFNLVLSLFMIGILVYSNYLNNEVKYKTDEHNVTYTKDGGKVVHESWNKDNIKNEKLKLIKTKNKNYTDIRKDYLKCINKVYKTKSKVIRQSKYGGNIYSNTDMYNRTEGIMNMYEICYYKYNYDIKENNIKVNKIKDIKIKNFNTIVKNLKYNISNAQLNYNKGLIKNQLQYLKYEINQL